MTSSAGTPNDRQKHQPLSNGKLPESEQRFRALIENSTDAISLINAEGRVLYSSPSYNRILGYTPESRLGHDTFELIHPDDLPPLLDMFAKILKNPEPAIVPHTRVRHSDGSWHWIEGVANNMLHVPAVGAIVVNFRDITDRKLAEVALLESEEKFLSITQQTLDLIAITDTDGIIIFASAASNTLFGISPEEMCGRPFMEFLDSSVVPRAVEIFRIVVERGERRKNIELTMRRHDGSTFIGELNGSGYSFGDRKGILVVIRDITERKLAELLLKESETRLRLLSDNLPGGMVYQIDSGINGEERVFTYVSAGVTRLHGITPEEAMQDAAAIYGQVVEEDRPMLAQREAEALENMSSFNAEVRIKIPSGEVRWSYFTSCPRRLSNNHLVWDGIEIDITEKMKLLESARRADKLEAIGLLAGGIAHDFNNLLGGIYGYLDIAIASTKEPYTAEHLQKTLGTMNRARGLTQQLLTFAKGGSPIRKVDRLMPFIEESARFALSGSNVSCGFDIPTDLWPCEFDRTQIGQVIDNLVINAQQAMPRGGEIEIAAQNITFMKNEHPPLAEGRYVRLTVIDRGIGIPRENLLRIFDPFFTTKTKGHGLGLATCYSIIKRHGGSIEVESELGKGSTFHVFLPAAAETAATTAAEKPASHRGTGTILVMDDEGVIRDTFGIMLKSFGYSVIATKNGAEAIDFFKTETAAGRKLSAMIFDLTIAGGTGGKETVKKIRKIDTSVPVFVASGYADDPVMAQPEKYGFTASICKPFTVAELAGVLNAFLVSGNKADRNR